MSYTRFKVSFLVDVDDEVYNPAVVQGTPYAEVKFSKMGVYISGTHQCKVQSIATDIILGGQTKEEYLKEIHKQIHRDHDEDPDLGGGSSGNKTTH